MRTKLLPLVLLILLGVSGVYLIPALMRTARRIGSTGYVKAVNVEVYWDISCTQPVSSIDWGAVEPGSSVDKTLYIKNTGNVPLILNMTYTDFAPPETANYLNLAWNREGYLLNVGAVVNATLTFTVSETVTGVDDFSFNIVIAGEG